MDDEPEARFVLMRFSKEKRVQDFLRGVLHFSPINYFRRIEADAVRSDPDESLHTYLQADQSQLVIDPGGRRIVLNSDTGLVGGIRIRQDASVTHIFCLYALNIAVENPRVDPRNFAFGPKAIVLKNSTVFMQRVEAAARRSAIYLDAGPVAYVSRLTHHGPMGPFRKFADFAYQSEYRLGIRGPDRLQPFRLSIGSLEDIAAAVDVSLLSGPIRFNPDA